MSALDDLADLVRASVEAAGVAVLDELRVEHGPIPFVRFAVADPDEALTHLRASYEGDDGGDDSLVVSLTGSRHATVYIYDPVSEVGPWAREVLVNGLASDLVYASNDDLRAALAATLRGPLAALVGDSTPEEGEGEGVGDLLPGASGETTGDVVVSVGLRESTPERYARGTALLRDLASGIPVEWAVRRAHDRGAAS